MHRSLGDFVGQLFYSDIGGLETGAADGDREVAVPLLARPHRVFWVDVAGREKPDGHSWWNPSEVDALMNLLKVINRDVSAQQQRYKVGVIAAYSAQAQRIAAAVNQKAPSLSALDVVVDTVDAFQGKQVDILLYSFVRSAARENPFIGDHHRLNVAFSRAKRALVIVGSRETARHQSQLVRALALIPKSNVLQLGDVT
jgi:superfamily I DNA and/or RNA helicase